MTPEDHEAYIAKLEREAEQSMSDWQRDKNVRDFLCTLFLIAILTGIICFFL